MRVLCCGDRKWTYRFLDGARIVKDTERNQREWDAIIRELHALPSDAVIIHGDCNGADRACGAVAYKRGMRIERYPADWEKYGNKAGPIRNIRMLKEGQPDLVLAFHGDIANSKGTAHMVKIAHAAGIPVRVFTA